MEFNATHARRRRYPQETASSAGQAVYHPWYCTAMADIIAAGTARLHSTKCSTLRGRSNTPNVA